MNFSNIIVKVTKAFIEAFNNRDFSKLRTLIVDEFVITSPNIKILYPEHDDNTIKGAESAIAYWQTLCQRVPKFFFENKILNLEKDDRLIIYTGLLSNGIEFTAKFTLNEYGKIEMIIINYNQSIL